MPFLYLFLALLPGFAWLFFYLEEDPRHESRFLLLLTFLAGAACALVALAMQLFLYKEGYALDPGQAVSPSAFFIYSLILLALSEELVKFLAAYLVVHNKPEFKLPIEAMVYMVVAALGFATVENLGSAFSPAGHLLLWNSVLESLSLRFVGATLLHALSSSIVGYYWALAIRGRRNWGTFVFGLLLATFLHAIFNYLIIVYGNLAFSLVFLVMVGLFALNDFEKLKIQTHLT